LISLKDIKGVGEATIKKLHELGITNVFKLFSFFPTKYIDLKTPAPLSGLDENQYALVEGSVESVSALSARGKRGFSVIFKDILSENRLFFKVSFFNQPYLRDTFTKGASFRIFGKPQNLSAQYHFVNPLFEKADGIRRLEGIYCVYPLKGLLGQNSFKNLLYDALNRALASSKGYSGDLSDVNFEILSCFEKIHRPADLPSAFEAFEKLAAIDTAIMYQLYLKHGSNVQKSRNVFYKISNNIIHSYQKALKYTLTATQSQANADILEDLQSDCRMSRLVNGDVGSGKTDVAFFALCAAASGGKQAVMMAPTEILARQHHEKFDEIAALFHLKSTLLVSNLPSKTKQTAIDDIASGKIDVVFGTQALISDGVKYKSLGLAVIDEQHKFGVADRAKLEAKGAEDILSLTATPIPRSMALMFYKDIDISYIKKREEARKNIKTSIIYPNTLEKALRFIAERALMGEQSFIVCPSITDSEGFEAYSIERFLHDNAAFLNNVSYGVLHGKMNPEQKTAVMGSFSKGDTKVLIATTVVEVGVDTQANNILVLNAERFGLATLHQLRGRVGRNGFAANCFLHCSSQNEKAVLRLEVLADCDDGQSIAEIDFDNRGAGEFLGVRQSGFSKTPIFGLAMNSAVLTNAKAYANRMLSNFDFSALLALSHCPKVKVDEFLDNISSITLNS
jgi:ATP-dependent DNA helicase RecG